MPNISSNLATHFPITVKINPLRKANWAYLLASATVTRFGVALMRAEENRPSRLKSAEMSLTEKKRAFAERCFMEFFGTAAYVFILHLMQDLAALFLENRNKDFLKQIKTKAMQEIKNGKSALDPEKFSHVFDEVTGTDTKGIIARVLYGTVRNGKLVRGTRRETAEKLGIPLSEISERLPSVLNNELRKKLNIMSTLSILFGVISSALIGGYGIQWLNDHPFSTLLKKFYPEKIPNGFLTIPSSTTMQTFGNTQKENPFTNAQIPGGSK